MYGQRGDSAYMSPTESLLPDAQGTQQSQKSNGSVGISRNLSRELAIAKQKTLELSPSAGLRDSPSKHDTPEPPKASRVPQVAPASGATPPKDLEEKDAMWWRPPFMNLHDDMLIGYLLGFLPHRSPFRLSLSNWCLQVLQVCKPQSQGSQCWSSKALEESGWSCHGTTNCKSTWFYMIAF